MRIRHSILIAPAILALLIAAIAAGVYIFFSEAPPIPGESPEISPSPAISPSPSAPAPFSAPTPSPIVSPRAELLRGRVIDVYEDQRVVTIQTPDGHEEVVELGEGSLPEGLARGDELQFSGERDTANGVFLARKVTSLTAGTLQFAAPLEEIKKRQEFSSTLFAKAITLEFGKALGKPKPFYLVIMDPAGRILTPFRNDIPSASYRVEGSVATLADVLASTQRIHIENMALGLWTLKLVILPGADMATIFGFEPGLAPKPLSELAGKLWYFNIAKR